MAAVIVLHLLAATIWVGGMFFAVYVMRLAAGPMEPPERVALWDRAFAKFFPWVWIAVIVLPATGYYMVFAGFSGFTDLPIPYHVMHVLGWVMIFIFLHLWFAPYARFRKAVADGDIPTAGKNLNSIRILVTTNLWLGLINFAFGVSGRYWG
tara:strand:+ start:2101 stop:2556 length:456 start_codon:yes stop_codon:yes gene_type:complete